MGRIFLGGGGDEDQSSKLDEIFVNDVKQGKILYLPIAQEGDESRYRGCLDWFSNAMKRHGVLDKQIVMWTSLEGKLLDEILLFDGIYIGGGSTGRLQRLLEESVFPLAIDAFLSSKGKAMYGGSAGAIIFGQSLKTVPEEMGEGKERREYGFGLIKDHSIRCHFSQNDREAIGAIQSALEDGLENVLAFPEAAGAVGDGKSLQVVGNEGITLFTKAEQILFPPGKRIELDAVIKRRFEPSFSN